MTNKLRTYEPNLKKCGFIVILIYIIVTVGFYFLAGEQLHFRQSRGNIDILQAEYGTIEMTSESVVEQVFTPKIQRLKSCSVQWGTYMRKNNGEAKIQLIDTTNDVILMEKKVDVSTITESQIIELTSDKPIENVYNVPLMLRITANSSPGSAASPMMSSSTQREGEFLFLNGTQTRGTLCFSVSGEDYIWIGLHYWKFVIGFGFVILMCCILVEYRVKNGKHSYIFNALIAMKKYQFLIRQLVSRDFKTKYKRSVLGILWSFLNPLLMMSVQYFVFSTIFESDIDNYPVYLLIGIIAFNFFSESCGMSLTSIIGNTALITKVYVPKYIYPFTRTISSVINLFISMIPLFIMMLITGVNFEKSAVLSLFFVVCLIIFSLGLGLFLSAAMVFFRDTQFLWNIFSMLWMYATPIFYPETILPDKFHFVLEINPLYYFLKCMRMCILDGISPEPILYVQSILMALVMFLVGAFVFRKTQDRFVLYL